MTEQMNINGTPADAEDGWRKWRVLSKNQKSATPPEFAVWLVELARMCVCSRMLGARKEGDR